jgi:hypothetical protein
MAAKTGHSWAANPSSSQSSATVVKEIGGGVACGYVSASGPFGSGGLLRVSVTMFSCPGVCLMSEVNSAMKDNGRGGTGL